MNRPDVLVSREGALSDAAHVCMLIITQGLIRDNGQSAAQQVL